jgi:hypothetical protein
MGILPDKETKGIIIRYLILVLLIMSVVLIGAFHNERDAFFGPVIMALLSLVIVCSHFIYNRIMYPAPDDLMYARRQDYIVAVVWCGIFFCYFELLACLRYVFLPKAFPMLILSSIIFQGLVFVPLVITIVYYISRSFLGNLPSIRNEIYTWHHSNPNSFWAFVIFVTMNIFGFILILVDSHGLTIYDNPFSLFLVMTLVLVDSWFVHYWNRTERVHIR